MNKWNLLWNDIYQKSIHAYRKEVEGIHTGTNRAQPNVQTDHQIFKLTVVNSHQYIDMVNTTQVDKVIGL